MLNIKSTTDGIQLSTPLMKDAVLDFDKTEARDFALALVSPETKVPAFQQDKMIWVPQSRKPFGIWLTEAGVLQVWIFGVTIPVTDVEVQAITEQLLSITAEFKVGDEVQLIGNWTGTDENGGSITVVKGAIGVVQKVEFGSSNAFTVKTDEGYSYVSGASNMKVAPPIQDYLLTIYANRVVSQRVNVKARDIAHAKKQGLTLQTTTWNPVIDSIPTIIDVNVALADVTAANAEDGFEQKVDGSLNILDAKKFKTPKALINHVTDKALAGDPRYAAVLRAVIAASVAV